MPRVTRAKPSGSFFLFNDGSDDENLATKGEGSEEVYGNVTPTTTDDNGSLKKEDVEKKCSESRVTSTLVVAPPLPSTPKADPLPRLIPQAPQKNKLHSKISNQGMESSHSNALRKYMEHRRFCIGKQARISFSAADPIPDTVESRPECTKERGSRYLLLSEEGGMPKPRSRRKPLPLYAEKVEELTRQERSCLYKLMSMQPLDVREAVKCISIPSFEQVRKDRIDRLRVKRRRSYHQRDNESMKNEMASDTKKALSKDDSTVRLPVKGYELSASLIGKQWKPVASVPIEGNTSSGYENGSPFDAEPEDPFDDTYYNADDKERPDQVSFSPCAEEYHIRQQWPLSSPTLHAGCTGPCRTPRPSQPLARAPTKL